MILPGVCIPIRMRPYAACFALLAASFACASAFYLPGVAPREFMQGDAVRGGVLTTDRPPWVGVTVSRRTVLCRMFLQLDVKVNTLMSAGSALGRNFYDLPFCQVGACPGVLSTERGVRNEGRGS